MEDYDSIARIVKLVRVEPELIEFRVESECGEFQQSVYVPRESRSEDSFGLFRSLLKRALKGIRGEEALEQDELQTASLAAFEQVRSRLNSVNGKWLRARKEEHPGDYFDRQLSCNPIVHSYDIEVLVRVLLEVSRSDSELRTEERTFLEEIVPDQETVKRLSQAPNLTVAELAETSSVAVKETILMLAWAMAYADGRLDTEEMGRLNQLCRGFQLPNSRVRELQMAAKLFLLDRHIQAYKSEMSLKELKLSFEEKAQQWGLDESQLTTLRGWYPQELG